MDGLCGALATRHTRNTIITRLFAASRSVAVSCNGADSDFCSFDLMVRASSARRGLSFFLANALKNRRSNCLPPLRVFLYSKPHLACNALMLGFSLAREDHHGRPICRHGAISRLSSHIKRSFGWPR